MFAERFIVPEKPAEQLPDFDYDEDRGYSVLTDGGPLVEAFVLGSTVTITEVRAEPADDDQDYDRVLASLDTMTRAQHDSD